MQVAEPYQQKFKNWFQRPLVPFLVAYDESGAAHVPNNPCY